MKKAIIKLFFFASFLLFANCSYAQCLNMINAATDSVGWIQGSDNSDYRKAFYYNDTFVVTTLLIGKW